MANLLPRRPAPTTLGSPADLGYIASPERPRPGEALRLSPFLEKGDPAIHVESGNRRTKVGIFPKEGIVNGPLD
jgi:hypothetical protein